MELAARLADYALSVRFSDLGKGAVNEMKARVVDAMGCAIGAAGERPVRIAVRALTDPRASGPATVIGSRTKTSTEHATFINGLMVRYFDFNDTYLSKEPAHPSDNIAPCLAVAEAEGSSGADLIAAAMVAYEVQCRLCDSADLRHRGWDHVNYGLVSAALGAAKLMGLDPRRSTHAVNIALSGHLAMRQVRAGELSMWKGASFANAARNAVFAATLAREGMTGPAPIFEGEMGFFKQVSGHFEVDLEAFGRRGDGFRVRQTYVKYWPAEYHAQSAIWAALEVRKGMGSAREVETVDVSTHEAGYTILGKDREKWSPKTRETADHSLPYIVAMALLDGTIDVSTYEEANLKKKSNLQFVAKVKVSEDPRLTALYPDRGMPNRVAVVLRSGRSISAQVDVPLGHPRNPLTRSDIEAKFLRLTGGRLGVRGANEAIKRLWSLEKEKDIAGLLDGLRDRTGAKA